MATGFPSSRHRISSLAPSHQHPSSSTLSPPPPSTPAASSSLSSAPNTPPGHQLPRLTLDPRLSSLPAQSITYRTQYLLSPDPDDEGGTGLEDHQYQGDEMEQDVVMEDVSGMEWSWTLCWVHMARIMMDTQMADQCGSLRMVPSPRQHRHHPPCLQGPLPHLHLPRSPPHHGHQHPLHQLFSTPWMRSRMCETSRSWISSGCSPTWRTGRTCGMA
jgi:hypothetical protein